MSRDAPYSKLSPETVLDAIEALAFRCDGRVLALNSYENRVYQIGIEDGEPVVAKFYRPARWSDAAIREEHAFAGELAAQEIPVVAPLLHAGESMHVHEGFRYAVFARRGGRWPELGNSDEREWVGRFLGLANPATDAAALAATLTDAEGVYFVPAMAGLGAPHWDSDARGTIAGLGRSHTSAHLARAAVDAIAFQVADVFFAIEQAAGAPLSDLHTDGGATRNASLMQFQADVLGRRVIRSANAELSAAGAAWLAGLALGWWSSLAEIEALPRGADVFTPMMEPAERDRLYRGWKTAVRRTRLRDEREA